MAGGRDNLGVAVAALAGVGHDAVRGAGGLGGHFGSIGVGVFTLARLLRAADGADAVHVVVAGGFGLVCRVGVAADGAGVGGVAALGAGGLGDNGLIAVSVGLSLVRNVTVAADGAGVGGVAALSAGGLGDDRFIAVSGGLGLVRCVGIAADGAGIGGVAALGAGGRGDNRLIAVSGGFHSFSIAVAADSADIDVLAVLRAGGFGGCVLIQLISMVAGGGDADRIAAEFLVALGAVNHFVIGAVGRAGGCNLVLNDGFACGVATGGDSGGLTAQFLAADGAVNHFVIGPLRCVGGCNLVFNHGFASGVSGGFLSFGIAVAADSADIDVLAVLRAGGFGGCVLIQLISMVAGGGDGDGLAAEFLAADGAVNHFVIGAVFGAGGVNLVLNDGFACCVTGGGDALGVAVAALGAGVGHDAVFGAGGLGGHFGGILVGVLDRFLRAADGADAVHIGVVGGGNDFTGGNCLAADGADRIPGVAVLCAGGGFGVLCLGGMAGGGDGDGLLVAVLRSIKENGGGVDRLAVFGAGGGLGFAFHHAASDVRMGAVVGTGKGGTAGAVVLRPGEGDLPVVAGGGDGLALCCIGVGRAVKRAGRGIGLAAVGGAGGGCAAGSDRTIHRYGAVPLRTGEGDGAGGIILCPVERRRSPAVFLARVVIRGGHSIGGGERGGCVVGISDMVAVKGVGTLQEVGIAARAVVPRQVDVIVGVADFHNVPAVGVGVPGAVFGHSADITGVQAGHQRHSVEQRRIPLAHGGAVDQRGVCRVLQGVAVVIQIRIVIGDVITDVIMDGQNLLVVTFAVQVQAFHHRFQFGGQLLLLGGGCVVIGEGIGNRTIPVAAVAASARTG